MAVEVVMPRLGWTMETGTFSAWLKRDGETVREGEGIFTVETDKVTQEVEAPEGGTLRIPPDGIAPGTEIAVGTVLAYLLRPGEAPPWEGARAVPAAAGDRAPAAVQAHQPQAAVAAPSAARDVAHALPAVSPRARRVAGELGVDWTAIAGSGRIGRIVERDVRAAAEQKLAARARVTPLARRVAEQSGIDLGQLAGQQPGARIRRADIEVALPPGAAPTAAGERPAGAAAGPLTEEPRPLAGARRIIAERMASSARTAAPVTLTTEADATELVLLRERIKRGVQGSSRPVPSYTDLLARLVALLLLEHPWMNSTLTDEGIVTHTGVHIGLAVDTERGLLVPVLRDAHRKSVGEIAAESAGLIERARAGTVAPGELRGGTFTITNLGMYEIDAFTPIINLPEVAILGVGRLVARQVVIDEEAGATAIRKLMALSLTFDHRAVDGGPAARFLQQVKRWVEQPYGWITA